MPISCFDFADGDEIHISQHVITDAEKAYADKKRERDEMYEFPYTGDDPETQPVGFFSHLGRVFYPAL